MSRIIDLVKVVCPDFPDYLKIKEVNDPMSWYLRSLDTLVVPSLNYLKVHTMELDRFAEAVVNFRSQDFFTIWNEDDLILKEFTGIDCYDKFKELRQMLQGKEVAVDIETRRLEYEDNEVLSIGFAFDECHCWAFYDIPVNGFKHSTGCTAHLAFRTYGALKDLLEDPGITYVWHNGKFDCTRLRYLARINARVDEDTMLLHYACINEKRGTHGLKELGPLYLQAPNWDDELDKIKREYCKRNKVKLADFTYDLIPTKILIPYMQRDCIATLKLLKRFRELARPNSEFIYRMLIRASEVYGRMELAGVQVDIEHLEDLEWELECDIKKANKNLNNVVSKLWDPFKYAKDTGAKSIPTEGFNPKSPAQLKWILKEALGYEAPSTDAATIELLLDQCEKGYIRSEYAKDLLESIAVLRKKNKYMDTYVQGMRNVLCRDGRVRCTYNLHGTETGRLSSSGPNMQNIPRNKAVKNLFKAKKGYKLLQLDYSQAELRVLAMLSQDPFMTQAYIDGKDFHDAVATDMFGPDFTKEQRTMAKTINFGIAYGRGASSISEAFGKSHSESVEIINKWFEPMPYVRDYINAQRQKPQKGEPCVTLLGRQRHFVITNETLYHVQNEYINTPIQSLASDFTMMSLLDIQQWIDDNGIDARIVITVHDSIILEVIDDLKVVDTVATNCMRIMAETPKKYISDCKVPFKADAEVGYSWGALSEWVMSN